MNVAECIQGHEPHIMVEDAPAPLPDMGLGKLTTLMQMGQLSYLIVKPCASHAMKELVRMGAN